MLLAFGIVCGIVEARASGAGQVVDAAMVDGAAVLTTIVHALRAGGQWSDEAGTNLLDSGAHFYEVYETSVLPGDAADCRLSPTAHARAS